MGTATAGQLVYPASFNGLPSSRVIAMENNELKKIANDNIAYTHRGCSLT